MAPAMEMEATVTATVQHGRDRAAKRMHEDDDMTLMLQEIMRLVGRFQGRPSERARQGHACSTACTAR